MLVIFYFYVDVGSPKLDVCSK